MVDVVQAGREPMKPRARSASWLVIAGWLLVAGAATAQNARILEQQLDAQGQGYTVIRVWGSHYEMGYAQANLLGAYIVEAVNETQEYVGAPFYDYLRSVMAGALWAPPEIEDELDGMVASLSATHPSAGIDELDLKVINTYGDWGYAWCRSHMCWGRYVAPPIKTLATRRLDFDSPLAMESHHVLCARNPDDGSPRWINLAWPGAVTVATGVNEFGTLASLHDYKSAGAVLSAGRMPRMVAARHALTFPSDGDLSTHLTGVFAELRLYGIMTNGFLNYYAPEGHGGVMTADRSQAGPDFYHLRLPQVAWHHGEAIITTNSWTDGTTTPADEDFGADAYYGDESPKTLESHWDLLAGTDSLHQLSVAYRGRGDMTLWADGRLDSGRTPRLEWEWGELFGPPCDDGIDNDGDGRIDFDPLTFASPGDQWTLPSGSGDPGCRSASSSTESPQCQNGSDDDSDGAMDYDAGLSRYGVADPAGPDPQCVGKPYRDCEKAYCGGCGLGIELLALVPLLTCLSRRRSGRNGLPSVPSA